MNIRERERDSYNTGLESFDRLTCKIQPLNIHYEISAATGLSIKTLTKHGLDDIMK